MTERINFGKGLGMINNLKAPQKTATSESEIDKARTDRVDFSTLLQEVSKARDVSAPVDPERAQRLDSLRAQIEAGTYRPDPEKVAASLINFYSRVK